MSLYSVIGVLRKYYRCFHLKHMLQIQYVTGFMQCYRCFHCVLNTVLAKYVISVFICCYRYFHYVLHVVAIPVHTSSTVESSRML